MDQTRNIKLVIAYEGTAYNGWQRQRGAPSVQETIETAAEQVIGRSITIRGASRTDSGVHADGQVAHFIVDSPIPDRAFAGALNGRLPSDIVIRSSEPVPMQFHASRDAMHKTYRYTLYTARARDVHQFRRRWRFPCDLDLQAINDAAGAILGTHDFRAFASAGDMRTDSVRTVFHSFAYRSGPHEIQVEITADRFLYHMVRNIVGTLVEIGRGRWPAEKIAEILADRDRTQAGPTAPGHGLCLVSIEYPQDFHQVLDTAKQ